MELLVNSNLAAILLLAVLVVLGSFNGLMWLTRASRRRKHFVILKVPQSKAKDLNKVIDAVNPPFTFEVAVSQLGKEKSFYITLPAGRAGAVESALGAERIEDYELYYPGGVHIGGYASGKDSIKDVNPDSIDFSAVNEIGEGAVVQLIFDKKKKGEVSANVRALVSAPSSFQAKEIFSNIKDSLDHIKFTEVKSDEFINSVNFRDFKEKELVKLTV